MAVWLGSRVVVRVQLQINFLKVLFSVGNPRLGGIESPSRLSLLG